MQSPSSYPRLARPFPSYPTTQTALKYKSMNNFDVHSGAGPAFSWYTAVLRKRYPGWRLSELFFALFVLSYWQEMAWCHDEERWDEEREELR